MVESKGNLSQKRVWLTWEHQRRSIELAKRLGCELFIIEYNGLLRYPKSIFSTITILRNNRPDILFVQNPSMILAMVACIYKLFRKIPVIVDRHTTFLLNEKGRNIFYIFVFKLLNRFTIQFADLTIVTNDFLASLVRKSKGKPFVLPDRLPEFNSTKSIRLKGKYNVLLISSFNKDEPIKDVIHSMNLVSKDTYLYVTGNYKRLDKSLYNLAPPNMIFCGFLEDQEFINMLFSVDIVMVLTTADYCMLCGCYEAVSASKPLITSDKQVLKDYFKGALFVDNTSEDILNGINQIISNIDIHKQRISALKQDLKIQWEESYNNLEGQLSVLK